MSTTTDADELLGREAERARLRAALLAAREGRGRLVVVTGEPGIGKSALAAAYGSRGETSRALVVWGRRIESERGPSATDGRMPARAGLPLGASFYLRARCD